jgi:hypothetical protein
VLEQLYEFTLMHPFLQYHDFETEHHEVEEQTMPDEFCQCIASVAICETHDAPCFLQAT